MATIVILEHLMQKEFKHPHLIYVMAERWRAEGHHVVLHRGTESPPDGDIAILNVDLTTVPDSYTALFDHYPKVINRATTNISKRGYSQQLLDEETDWDGPVIVKTDANFGGRMDQKLRQLAIRGGHEADVAAAPALRDYPIFPSVEKVPEDVWKLRELIVEKFLPERDEHGFYMRVWLFLGDRERSFRFRANVPVIKSHHVVDREAIEVPPQIREWRRRLGFDYGKFDYVVPADEPILIDANRTPGQPAQLHSNPEVRAGIDELAEGLYAFIERP